MYLSALAALFTYTAPNDETQPRYDAIGEAHKHAADTLCRYRARRKWPQAAYADINDALYAFAAAIVEHGMEGGPDLELAVESVSTARMAANAHIQAGAGSDGRGMNVALDELLKAKLKACRSVALNHEPDIPVPTDEDAVQPDLPPPAAEPPTAAAPEAQDLPGTGEPREEIPVELGEVAVLEEGGPEGDE